MRVVFKENAFKKLRAYVNSINYEISGLGRVEKTDDALIVTDVRIFEQTVTGGHTDLEPQALARFYNQIIDEEGDLSKWKLWWHSHCDFDAFFSGTDLATIDDFDSEMPNDNWMLSIVTNHEGKLLARADIYQPIRCTMPDLVYAIEFEEGPVKVDVTEEIKEKVQINIPTKKPANRNLTRINQRFLDWWTQGGMTGPYGSNPYSAIDGDIIDEEEFIIDFKKGQKEGET